MLVVVINIEQNSFTSYIYVSARLYIRFRPPDSPAQPDGSTSWLSSFALNGEERLGIESSRLESNPGADLAALIDKILTYLPNVTIIVGTIPPMQDPSFTGELAGLQRGHSASVNERFQAGRKIYFADINAAMTLSDLTSDGIHPNTTGYNKMADVWFGPLSTVHWQRFDH